MISAVVINWNGRHYLEGCLDSLLAQRPVPDEIILVDNHSDDGSRAFVGERYPDVRIVDTGHNAGPAYARNMGVAAALHDRVLLIDNDVTMETGALARLNDALNASSEAAIVQARSVCADATDVVHYDATDIHYLGLLVLHNWFAPVDSAKAPEGPIGGLVALCFLADRGRYLDSGGFNSDLFILFEDTEFAWRLRMAGERILLAPGALVRHGGGTKNLSMRGPAASYPARRVFLHSRNRWLVLLTCLHWRSLLLLLLPQLAYGLIQFVFACVKGHPIAWCHGKLDMLRLLPRVLTWRKNAQRRRTVPDRELLVAGPLTLNPGLAERGAARILHGLMNRSFTAWWKVFGRFCG